MNEYKLRIRVVILLLAHTFLDVFSVIYCLDISEVMNLESGGFAARRETRQCGMGNEVSVLESP